MRLSPDGNMSHDLREGVAQVKVPDEWDNVAGVVPDLICYGAEGKPIRIVEVVVTSGPTEAKQVKLDTLKTRGVDVVLIHVKDMADLKNLCWVPAKVNFSWTTARDKLSTNSAQNTSYSQQKNQMDRQVQDMIVALPNCSPAIRQLLPKHWDEQAVEPLAAECLLEAVARPGRRAAGPVHQAGEVARRDAHLAGQVVLAQAEAIETVPHFPGVQLPPPEAVFVDVHIRPH